MRRTLTCMLLLLIALFALPLASPLLAQGGIVLPENAPLWMTLLAPLVPIVAGALANYAMDGLRLLIARLDTANTYVKRIVSVLLAMLTGWLATKFGATLDPDLHNITANALVIFFTVLAQQGIFKQKADKVAAAQGEATVTQQRLGVSPASARRS